MKYLPDLIHWIQEREKIRKARELRKPPPWTSDPIIANNRWCNVHRENDKVTRWIFQNFLPTDLSDPSIPFALCVARLVNWPDTLVRLGYPSEGWTEEYRKNWFETFAERRAVGMKSWTGAYMVTGGFSAGGEGKEDIIARVLGGAAERCEAFNVYPVKTLHEASVLLATPGMGPFLVAQVIADLKNTQHLRPAIDWWTWCAPGPGSVMGLNFVHERPRSKVMGSEQFMVEVDDIRDVILGNTGLELCAQNTQNCLCELSKYVRAKHYGERLKNTYRVE
jgi:hypothetical protein